MSSKWPFGRRTHIMACGACETVVISGSETHVVVVVTDKSTNEYLTIDLCDSCRRKVCTCERCMAYVGVACYRMAPRALLSNEDFTDDFCPVDSDDWCIEGWKQAHPIQLEEFKRIIGIDE